MQDMTNMSGQDAIFEFLRKAPRERGRNFLDRILYREAEELWLLEPQSRQAIDLRQYYGDRENAAVCFDYERRITERIRRYCADTDTTRLVMELSIGTIARALYGSDRYRVRFSEEPVSGNLRWKTISFYPADRECHFFCVAVEDVTDLVMPDADRNQKLRTELTQVRNRALAAETVLSILSREMRTPLNSILGLTDLAKSDTENAGAMEGYLEKIAVSGTHLRDLMDDMVRMRKMLREETRQEAEPFDLRAVINELNSDIAPLMEEKGLKYHFFAEDLHAPVISADRGTVSQLLAKLLKTAMYYAGKGDTLEFRVTELYQRKKRTMIRFAVSSPDQLIEQEQLKNVFRPADYFTTLLRQNLNDIDPGLIIFKNYVALLGGTLMVQSSEENGTEFAVTMTFVIADNVPGRAETEEIMDSYPAFRGRRVLLVDDSPINLEMEERLLERAGLSVVTASNGSEAVDLFMREGRNFDVILMDIRMPVMDGLEAAREIRSAEAETGHSTPIIALTANAFETDVIQSFGAGMNEHLVKPIEPKRLCAVLSHYIK